MVPQYEQQLVDAEQIKLLVIFHYVLAGFIALGACFPVFHLLMGLAMVSGKLPAGSPPASGAGAPDLALVGWGVVIVCVLTITLGWVVAVLTFFAGKRLSARRSWTFVFVMACLLCTGFPMGTALGVFTIIVLNRPSVKGLFESGRGGGI